jgi:hypothetical protein
MDGSLGLALAGVALALLARLQTRASRLERALARRGESGPAGASRGARFETAATWLLAVAACIWLWADLGWRLWRGAG